MATEVAAPQLPDQSDTEELLYAAVVQILSEDLYPRKLETLREYIQNASDAIDDWLRISDLVPESQDEPQIKISIQMRSLIIYDNGIGMLEEDIPKLKRIAYSEKKAGEEAGYKGIGRLAGIAVADKLKISSTSYGDARLHHFEFRAADMRKDVSDKKRLGIQEPASPVIRRHTDIWWTDVDPADHYTIVEIRDIKESCSDLLDVAKLIEYVGDIGPVDFSPAFTHGAKISDNLRRHVPDYSPKAIYLSDSSTGKRIPIFKPYIDAMKIAEPTFREIRDPSDPSKLLAYSWYSSNGEQILGKIRPTGKIFQVPGDSVEEKRRFAGLVYKLFGFSVGDRSLPERTLWTTARARAAWFTGEIHVVDKQVMPTTDRTNFIESDSCKRFYQENTKHLVNEQKNLAQEISDNRKAFQDAKNLKQKLDVYKTRLDGADIERSDLKPIREEIDKGFSKLRGRKCTDKEISGFQKEVQRLGTVIQEALNDPKKLKQSDFFSDLPKDLDMPSKARRVLQIVMETLQQHFSSDREEYHSIADKIRKAIRAKY